MRISAAPLASRIAARCDREATYGIEATDGGRQTGVTSIPRAGRNRIPRPATAHAQRTAITRGAERERRRHRWRALDSHGPFDKAPGCSHPMTFVSCVPWLRGSWLREAYGCRVEPPSSCRLLVAQRAELPSGRSSPATFLFLRQVVRRRLPALPSHRPLHQRYRRDPNGNLPEHDNARSDRPWSSSSVHSGCDVRDRDR